MPKVTANKCTVRGQVRAPQKRVLLESWHFWVFAHLSKTVPSPAWLLRLCKMGCVPGSCTLLLWFQTLSRHHPQCPEDSHGLYLPSRQCRRKSFTWMRTETGHLRRQDIIGLKLNRRKRLKKVVGHFVSFVFTAMTKSLYVFPFCWKGAFKNEA